MKKLKYGIIGTGGISNKHLTGYSALKEDVEIVAASDIQETRLKATAEKYDIHKCFKNYKDLLKEDIDFVSICLPNYMHSPVTIEALEAGKHVHCEKPMAMNAKEARLMIDAKNRTGKKLMIGLNNRFTEYATYVKKYIDEGNLGEIYFAKCGWMRRGGLPYTGWFADKDKAGGGALIDLGVHFIDLTMYFMGYPGLKSVLANTYRKFGGSEISPLYAYQSRRIEPGMKFDVDDLASGTVNLANDASIFFEISWASNIQKEKVFYDIYGTKGGISFSHDFVTNPELNIYTAMNGQLVDIHPLVNANLYDETEFKHFANCVRNNKEPIIAPPEQGVEIMRLIDGIYASSENKSMVSFD